MNTEWQTELERRAALHAALADPGRLRIVEHARARRPSPSELARRARACRPTCSPTTCEVLDRARAGHPATGRRATVAAPTCTWRPTRPTCRRAGRCRDRDRVLFVCTANSARSHLAAALWRRTSRMPRRVRRHAPRRAVDPGAVAAAAPARPAAARTRSPGCSTTSAADGDLVVTVCDNAHEELGRRADLHWSVPDPVPAGDDAAFDAAFDEIARRVHDLAPRLAHA